jgi:hypothetical protein
MNKLIVELPQDIIDIIISYTYNLQNKELLDDIQDYTKSKKVLFHNYYDYWISYINEEEPEDKYWLINDLISYTNNHKATMYGYTNNFYDIFYRNILLKTNEDVDKYIINLDDKNVNSQINIVLGLLTKQERYEFICNTFFTKVI